jgi:hypothetical protein
VPAEAHGSRNSGDVTESMLAIDGSFRSVVRSLAQLNAAGRIASERFRILYAPRKFVSINGGLEVTLQPPFLFLPSPPH